MNLNLIDVFFRGIVLKEEYYLKKGSKETTICGYVCDCIDIRFHGRGENFDKFFFFKKTC